MLIDVFVTVRSPARVGIIAGVRFAPVTTGAMGMITTSLSEASSARKSVCAIRHRLARSMAIRWNAVVIFGRMGVNTLDTA